MIPLCPERVGNAGGTEKQDSETNAAKRLLGKLKKTHPKLPLIIDADSLYSNQPMIKEIRSSGNHYVLVAKPDDHKLIMEWVNEVPLSGYFLQPRRVRKEKIRPLVCCRPPGKTDGKHAGAHAGIGLTSFL